MSLHPTPIERLEEAYALRLGALLDFGYEVQVMPEIRPEQSRPGPNSRITVGYSSSRFGDKTSPGRPEILSMGVPHEEEFLEFALTIESNRLRGVDGVYAALELCRRLLLGFEPIPGYRRTTFMRIEYVNYADNWFGFDCIISTSTHVVPAVTPESEMGAIFEDEAPTPEYTFLEGRVVATTTS